MKKQKKAKTGFSSSRRASRAAPASTSPQVLHISSAPLGAGDPLLAFASKCQQVYATARTTDAAGGTRLDQDYLARALADAGIGALAEQALFSLALMAASDGQETLVEDDVLAALQVTAQAS